MGEPDKKNQSDDWKQVIDTYDKQTSAEEQRWTQHTIPVGVNFDDYPKQSPTVAVNCFTRNHWRRMVKGQTGLVTVYMLNGRALDRPIEMTQADYLRLKHGTNGLVEGS